MRAEKRIVELVDRLSDTTASVYLIPDLFIFDLMRARWTKLVPPSEGGSRYN